MPQGVIVGGVLFVLFAGLLYVIYQAAQYRKNHPLLDAVEPTALSVHQACLNWQPPAELLSSPPRTVRVETGTLASAVFFEIIILAMFYGMCYVVLLLKTQIRGAAMSALSLSPGVLVAVLMAVAVQSSRHLLQNGQVTGALVTAVRNPFAGIPLDDGHGRTRYADAFVRFAFLDQNRNLVRGRGKLRAGAQPGQVVTVVFDPTRPERNSLYPMDGLQVQG